MTFNGRLRRRFGLLAAMAAAIAALAPLGSGSAQVNTAATTLDRTILDIVLNGDGRLECADGEPLLVREELAKAQAGRESRPRALASFFGFTDFQLADKESPPPTSSSFTRTYGTARGREVDEPATHSALPDWAIASASLLFFAAAALFWIAHARVRDSMLGVPARRPPLG